MSTPIQNCTWVDGMSPGDTRMTIDPEKLEEALEYYSELGFGEHLVVMREAARAHLANLPRYKEVEISVWKVVDEHGNYGTDCTQEIAEQIARTTTTCRAVRLTGTAKVRVTP